MRTLPPMIVALAAVPIPVSANANALCPVAVAERMVEPYAVGLVNNGADAAERLDHLIACLADPNPAARDDFAFTTLAKAMRSDGFPAALTKRSHDRLLDLLADKSADLHAVRRPFAILALAEVARFDRLIPFLSPADRRALAAVASAYLRGVSDYRGFTEGEGWRHGVAHGADLMMQLALHPDLDPADIAPMLDAIAAQVAPTGGHSYIHGESRRLTRPLLILAGNDKVTDEQLAGFFKRLMPDGSPRWAAPYASPDGLAALHNSRAFALPLLVDAMRSKEPSVQRLEAPLVDLLRALP